MRGFLLREIPFHVDDPDSEKAGFVLACEGAVGACVNVDGAVWG